MSCIHFILHVKHTKSLCLVFFFLYKASIENLSAVNFPAVIARTLILSPVEKLVDRPEDSRNTTVQLRSALSGCTFHCEKVLPDSSLHSQTLDLLGDKIATAWPVQNLWWTCWIPACQFGLKPDVFDHVRIGPRASLLWNGPKVVFFRQRGPELSSDSCARKKTKTTRTWAVSLTLETLQVNNNSN